MYNYYLISACMIIVTMIIVIIILAYKKKAQKAKFLKILDKDYKKRKSILEEKIKSLESDISSKSETLNSLNIYYAKEKERLEAERKRNIEIIDEERKRNIQIINEEKEKNLELLEEEKKKSLELLEEEKRKNKEFINEQKEEYIDNFNKEKLVYEKELDDLKKIQLSINASIIKEKEKEEKGEFYKILINNTDIEDIKLLKDLKNSFNKKEIINKLIYETYIKAPLMDLIKRVLQNRKVSGIYKITYLKTGESYIGRSTDVSRRWQEHIKSAFDIGTIASSYLHTRLYKDGIENYSFELLEEVSKEELNSREKYYINFYDTKNCGLNMKNGSD